MRFFRNFSIALILTVVLAACTELPPLNFAVANVQPSERKIDAELKSITVTMGGPNEVKGEMAPGVETVATFWQTALVDAMNRSVIFRDSAVQKVSLSTKVLKFDIPAFGIEMQTDVIARYEVIDRESGKILFTRDIETSGVVPGDYAFVGAVRARESHNRAVQANIKEFLRILEVEGLVAMAVPTS